MTTLRELLNAFDFCEEIGTDDPTMFDSEVSHAEWAVKDGNLQHACGGGRVIAYFYPAIRDYVAAYIRTPQPIALIVDDSDGESWSVRAKNSTMPLSEFHKGRPHPRLRLAQTA